MANSHWKPHPGLAEALALGCEFDQWLGGRTPIVSYARSSRESASGGRAVGRQHVNNDGAAAARGWAVVYQYTDDGISAADPHVERPAYSRMVSDIRLGRTPEGFRIGGAIAVEEERMARLPDDYLSLCRALAAHPPTVLFWVDSSEFVDVHGQAESAGAAPLLRGQTEVETIRRRKLRSVRDNAREGRGGGGARFGWLGPDAETWRQTNTVLDAHESPYLRGAIERALAGHTWTSIADWLLAEGVPTVRGSKWTVPTVQAMVTNPAVCGYRLVDGDLVRDGLGGEPVFGVWETVATPEEWTALVSRCDRWYSLDPERPSRKQAYKSGSRGNGPGGNVRERAINTDASRKYLLSGFLLCGYKGDEGQRCDFKMGGHPPHGTNRQASYRCSPPGCRKVGRRVDSVDTYVESVVLTELERRFGGTGPVDRRYPGEEQLAELRARHQPGGPIRNLIHDMEREREQFLARLAEENFLAGFTRERWILFDTRRRRGAVSAVVKEIVVHPLPKGRPRNAPFDPAFIEVVLRGDD
ncbi:recombinase family protein [Streptomyces sp. NBC_01242]|uniref:recombinase family protein n=1 Tax=Streptomyces sp. NBC_01242 TaxID=2903795 RepID=UPI0022524B0F|nr:recombinase family protein [Streptomyces sp. NBC_01242]MCX4795011.1 recombinase family protein [Streptomyces sp. NBC_01242]